MLRNTILLVAAVATATPASPYKPAIAVRKPPNTTAPTISRPTSVDLTFTSFYESNSCTGNSIPETIHSGQCHLLSTPARSWRTYADVNLQQVQMFVYGNSDCRAPGMVEHLSAGSACFTMSGLAGTSSNASARSIMINV